MGKRVMMDEQRFGGVNRLYGRDSAQRIASASAAIVGVGGVGSWAAEALARSGIGSIILMDADDICVSTLRDLRQDESGSDGRAVTSY